MAGKAKSGIPDPKGHQASSPAELPAAAWKDIASRTWQRTWDDNVGLVAAGVAFYGFFALLSLLAMIVLVYGLVAEPKTVVENFRALTTILPTDVAALIADQLLNSVQMSSGRTGIGVLLALLVALYGGSNGAAALITSLNIAYQEKEKRSLLHFYLVAVGITVIAVVLAVLALVATTIVTSLQELAPQASPAAVVAGKLAAYLLLVFAAAGVAATLYRFAPSREEAKWTWITPGSMFTGSTWLMLTLLFGLYVANLTDYSATYGSLGATVGLLTWLYLSAYVLVLGAELNSEIEHQTSKDSTTGEPRPMGTRGAWAADNVATDDSVQDRPEEEREGEKLTRAAPQVAEEGR